MWCDLRRGAAMKVNFSRFGKIFLQKFLLCPGCFFSSTRTKFIDRACLRS